MISSKRYVRDTFGATRPLIKGCKWAAFWGLVPFVLLYCVSQLLVTHIHHLPKADKAHWLLIYGFAWPYIEVLITAPIIGGWYMMGMKRLSGDTNIAKNEAYRYLRYAFTFIAISAITYFIAHLLNYLSIWAVYLHHRQVFAALSLAGLLYGILINFLFWPSMMIAADLHCPFWRAMTLSARITCRYFWPGVRLFVCWALINVVGLLLVGIGLFWTIPWSFLVAATFYSDIKADLLELTHTQ